MHELQQASEQDGLLVSVRKYLQTNKWQKDGNLKPYFFVWHKLTVNDNVIFKDSKLVISKKLQTKILELTHESHRG